MHKKLQPEDMPSRMSYEDAVVKVTNLLRPGYPADEMEEIVKTLEFHAAESYCMWLNVMIDQHKSFGPMTRFMAFEATLRSIAPSQRHHDETPDLAMLRQMYRACNEAEYVHYAHCDMFLAVENLFYAKADQLEVEKRYRNDHPKQELNFF